MYITIQALFEAGKNKSQIARLTGHDWKTVDKVIKLSNSGQKRPVMKPKKQKLDTYKKEIVEFIERDLSGIRIHEKLQELGVFVSYPTVSYFLRKIKKNKKICIRFNTEPGQEAQIDFGYLGLVKDNNGKLRKTWIFNMRLSFSRLDFYKKVHNQTVETFIQCHIEAFKFFGGVPKTLKIDNLKAAILKANFYEPIYQETYKKFSEHYGFFPLPCKVRAPREKGKVESAIKYVKNNFFAGRSFISGDDFDRQLQWWVINTCNARIHGTTRKVPAEVFEKEEKKCLLALPQTDFYQPKVGIRNVHHDCHIFVESNYYSVPFEYVGKNVEVTIYPNVVKIFYEEKQIAMHERVIEKGSFKTSEQHYPSYLQFSSTKSQDSYREKMAKIGENTLKVYQTLVDKYPYNWQRMSSGILSLSKRFSPDVVEKACKRALAFNAVQYRKIKSICESGSYNLPL